MKVVKVAAIVCLAAAAAQVHAQTGAMVRGTAVDEKGAPVADVKVEISFAGTRRVATNKKSIDRSTRA